MAVLGQSKINKMRVNAARLNYYQPTAYITIGGTRRETLVRFAGLSITEFLNSTPNVARFRVSGFTPSLGQDVNIYVGSTAATSLVFAGTITDLVQVYEDIAANVAYDIECLDYAFLMDRRLVFKSYPLQSATTIAKDIISTFTSGYTTNNVQAGLSQQAITFNGIPPSEALTQLAQLGGWSWRVGYTKDLRFGVLGSIGMPDPDTITASITLALTKRSLLNQVRTRVYVIGKGTTVVKAGAIGDTTLSVADSSLFVGTTALVKGGQKITYTGTSSLSVHATAWTARTPPGSVSRVYNGIAWSPALRLFVAVESDGASVITSPDGITWTERSSSFGLNIIAWSPSLNLFAAVKSNSTTASTSPDGVAWTARVTPVNRTWFSIVWSPDKALFIAVGAGDGVQTDLVMTSPDGITWTSRTASVAKSWRGVAWSPSLSLFAAVNNNNDANGVMTSPDGITWTTQGTPAGTYKAIAWGPTPAAIFVAVADSGAVISSPDGITWTTRTPTGTTSPWSAVVWSPDEGVFVVVATNSAVMTSPDGITWTTGEISASNAGWVAIAWSPSISRYVVTGTARIATNDSTVTARLTGIPASGAGSIGVAINIGDEVRPYVQRDDVPAQTALATSEGGDGIHEDKVDDTFLVTVAQMNTAGDAKLTLFKSAEVRIHPLAARDYKLIPGTQVTMNVAAPTSITGTFTVQSVTVTQIGLPNAGSIYTYPLRTIEAGTTRFTLQDLLRLVGLK